MKYVRIIVLTMVACLIFSSCSKVTEETDYFGFKKSAFAIIEEEDTHGGFHGDGSYFLILDCSKNTEQAKNIIKDWKHLPLAENLQLIMYGGEKDGVGYAYNFAEIAHWPVIHNGVFKFVDRHSEAIDQSDDTDLFDRYSVNFSIAVYDFDTNILYYFEMDT